MLSFAKKGKFMNLIVNGEDVVAKDGITLLEFLQSRNIEEKVMAAAVNMDIVKQTQWGDFELKDGDKLELLDFVGGG